MNRRLGILAMLGAVAIYGANFGISRHALLNGLTPDDLVALRYGIAGTLLLPVFIRRGVADCAGVGWRRGIVLAIMSGVPMALLMNTGLAMAPASHAAAIGPGTVTVIGVIGSMVLFGVKPSRPIVIGIGVVLAGLAAIGVAGSRTGGPSIVVGDLLFLATGLLWGFYPLLLQKWNVGAMTSTAIVSVLSLVYIPVYALLPDAADPRGRPMGRAVPWHQPGPSQRHPRAVAVGPCGARPRRRDGPALSAADPRRRDAARDPDPRRVAAAAAGGRRGAHRRGPRACGILGMVSTQSLTRP